MTPVSKTLPPVGVQVWVKYDNGREGINWIEHLIDGFYWCEDEGKVVEWCYLSEVGGETNGCI